MPAELNWHTKLWTAERLRAEAERWEQLAKLADSDGDAGYAENARHQAARLREAARHREVDTTKPLR